MWYSLIVNTEKIKEVVYIIIGFIVLFGIVSALDYFSESDERVKKEILMEVIPKCAEEIIKDLSKYDSNGNIYYEVEPGAGLNFSLGENLSNCVSENYPG